MNRFSIAALVGAIAITASSAAMAQDAGTTPQTQTTTPPPDTSSPLTPSNNNGSPLTPNPVNPVTGQTQQSTSSAAVQSSSEVPATFTPPPIETNRVDPSADTSLRLSIDPSSSAAVLTPDATSLAPTTAGLSLNAVQGTTPISISPSSALGSVSSPTSTSFYPAAIAEPAATQAFLQGLSSRASRGAGAARGSSTSTAMGPLIGSAAVTNASAVETMASMPASSGSSAFMRTVGSSSVISPSIAATSNGLNSIGPRALRPAFRGSSSMFSGRAMSWHASGGSHR